MQAKGCSLDRFTKILEEIENQPAWRSRADREADYYDGNQLDSDILQAQKEKGIPPSIENLIGRTVNDILGMEAKNRTDWKVLPESEASGDDVASALNQKLNKAERDSGADRSCSTAHSSQVKVGIGWVEVVRETDPFKFDYRCQAVHRNEIWWDIKSTAPDLSDAMWLMRRRWVNTDIAQMMFPGKKEIIRGAGTGWESIDLATLSTEGGSDTGLAASLDIERGWTVEEQEWRDVEGNKVCLFEVHTRHYKNALILKTPDGRVVEFDKKDPIHRQAVQVGYPLQKTMISEIWKTFFLGPYRLQEEKVQYKHGKFQYVPFWGVIEDRTGVPYGVIRDLMYLQDEVNARISKMQWGLAATRTERTENAVAMSEEVFHRTIGRPDADIILNKKEMQTGGVFKVERDFDLNAQQYNRLQDLRASINIVSGVSEAFSGTGGQNTASGLSAQIEQTVQSLAKINDNFSFSRKMVGDLLLEMIIEDSQDQEEIIVSGGLIKDDRVVMLNTPAVDHDTGVEYKDNDVQRTKLKVTLADVPSTPSFRQQQLSAMSEAFKSAPPQFQSVMMPHLTALMDIPNKEEIVEAIRNIAKSPTPDEIEQRVSEAVSQALSDSDRALKERELDIKERLTAAQIEKLVNESVDTAIKSMYSAMQAAGVITNDPATAPLADKLLRSGGYVDKDSAPIVPGYNGGIPGQQAQPIRPPVQQDLQPNYDPTTPVPVPTPGPGNPGGGSNSSLSLPGPRSAGDGVEAGIETQAIESP